MSSYVLRITFYVNAWVKTVSEVYKLNIGLFGASTGGAAALLAAAQRPDLFQAIVSRGGRPDLTTESLPAVKAPTLLIVGELDSQVLLLNQYALRLLTCEKKLEIVRGATHLFEENGKLEIVASHASSPDPFQIAVVRYNPNGTLDPTFGNGGVQLFTLPNMSAKFMKLDLLQVSITSQCNLLMARV